MPYPCVLLPTWCNFGDIYSDETVNLWLKYMNFITVKSIFFYSQSRDFKFGGKLAE